jgi:hypothetical protein
MDATLRSPKRARVKNAAAAEVEVVAVDAAMEAEAAVVPAEEDAIVIATVAHGVSAIEL